MSKTFRLKRTVQCAKCPFKKSTNPFEIPNGYSVEMHKNLQCTIATDKSNMLPNKLNVMACHHSKDLGNNAEYCIGWLHNQLGIGNNIALRLKFMQCENAKDIRVIGEQHDNFFDTLPKV